MGQYKPEIIGPVIIVDDSGDPINLSGNITNLGNISIVSGVDVNPTIAGNRTNNQVVAGNVTPTELFAADASPLSRKLVNTSGNITLFVGDSGVTSSTGYPVAAGHEYEEQNNASALHGISATGNITVGIMGQSA